jgi:phage repressor protein C with HTH and peptisase S24 domain
MHKKALLGRWQAADKGADQIAKWNIENGVGDPEKNTRLREQMLKFISDEDPKEKAVEIFEDAVKKSMEQTKELQKQMLEKTQNQNKTMLQKYFAGEASIEQVGDELARVNPDLAEAITPQQQQSLSGGMSM